MGTVELSYSCEVAVGTEIAPAPRTDPYGHTLVHTAPTSGVGVKARPRFGMQDLRARQVTIDYLRETLPRQTMPLTATPKRRQPQSRYFPPESLKRREVTRYRVVIEVALYYSTQPFPGLDNPLMPALAQLLLDSPQFAP